MCQQCNGIGRTYIDIGAGAAIQPCSCRPKPTLHPNVQKDIDRFENFKKGSVLYAK